MSFPEPSLLPPEPAVIGPCSGCLEDVVAGEDALEYGGRLIHNEYQCRVEFLTETFCSRDHDRSEWLLRLLGAKTKETAL